MDVWKIEKNLCRCCHVEGSFKNLNIPCYDDDGDEVVYLELLQHTLDVTILPVMGALCNVTFSICNPCIQRLKDAVSFKKQILLCEERFKYFYSNDLLATGKPIIKTEIADEEDVKVFIEKAEPDSDSLDEVKFEIDDSGPAGDSEDDAPLAAAKTKSPKKATKKPAAKPRAKKTKTKPNPEAGDAGEEKPRKRASKFRLKSEDYSTDGSHYVCRRCDKRYDKQRSITIHMRRKHYNVPTYACPYCDMTFTTAAPLTTHKLQEHNIDDRIHCNACKGTFNTKIQLKKHINTFHMMGVRHKCEECDYETFSIEGLYKHKYKHKTVKDYQCRFCKKAFIRKSTLDLHERIHTGDRRKVCSVCSQAFVQKASLNYHMAKYHPEVMFQNAAK